MEGVHALAEVPARRGDDQVEVVSHDREGMQLPCEAVRDEEDGFQEDLLRGLCLENRLAELGAIVDVVSALIGDEPSTPGHGRIVQVRSGSSNVDTP